MKQNIVISIYQVSTIALCTYLVAAHCGFTYPSSLVYIVGLALLLNILVIIFGWKRIGYTRRSRVGESIMLIVSAFTPVVSYFTLADADAGMFISPSDAVGMLSFGQAVWVVSIYISPDIVGMIREK